MRLEGLHQSAGSEALVHRVREPAGDPAGALVLLHGRGADEHDLYRLIDLLDPSRRLLGVTARGPLSLPPGGAHWYAVRSIGYPDPATFRQSYGLLTRWLDAFLAERGIAHQRTVIGGFSQGAVMSYATALGAGRPRPAGLIGLSGFIPTVEGFELDLTGARGLPVAIGHGTHDPVIGIEWGHGARRCLGEAGADLTYAEAEMGHQIDPGFLAGLPAWVQTSTPPGPGRPLNPARTAA